jgi:hypothetical protein
LKYDKTGLIVNSESINDVGIRTRFANHGSFSNINLVLKGKRGTISSGLIQENYANFSVDCLLMMV